MKVYCQDCGSPNEYLTKKPNFCQGCGQSFAKGVSPVVKKNQAPAVEVDYDADSDDLDDSKLSVPDIDSLQVDIQVDKHVGINIKQVMGTQNNGEAQFDREPDEVQSSENFLESFRREAGSIKPSLKRKKNEGL